MASESLHLIAEVSPKTAPDQIQTLPLFADKAHPGEYLLNIEGKLQTLTKLREKYNICILKA